MSSAPDSPYRVPPPFIRSPITVLHALSTGRCRSTSPSSHTPDSPSRGPHDFVPHRPRRSLARQVERPQVVEHRLAAGGLRPRARRGPPFGEDTRDDTLTRAAERIRRTQYEIHAYAECLNEEKSRLDRELTAGIGLIPLVIGGKKPGPEILYPVATVILGGLTTSTLCEFLIHPGLFRKFSGKDAEQLTRSEDSDEDPGRHDNDPGSASRGHLPDQ